MTTTEEDIIEPTRLDDLEEKVKALSLENLRLKDEGGSYVKSKPAGKVLEQEYVKGTHYTISDAGEVVPIFKNLESALSDPVDVFGLLETISGRYITLDSTYTAEWPEEVVKGVCLNFKRTKAMFKIRDVLKLPYLGDHVLVHQGKSNPNARQLTLKRLSGWLGYINMCYEAHNPDAAPVTAFGAYIEVAGPDSVRDTRFMKTGVTTGLAYTMDFVQHLNVTKATKTTYNLTRVNEKLDMDTTSLEKKLRMIVSLFCAAVMIDVNSPLPDYPLMSTLLARNAQDPSPYVSFMSGKFVGFVGEHLPRFCLGQKTGDKVVADFRVKYNSIMSKDIMSCVARKETTSVGSYATKKITQKESTF